MTTAPNAVCALRSRPCGGKVPEWQMVQWVLKIGCTAPLKLTSSVEVLVDDDVDVVRDVEELDVVDWLVDVEVDVLEVVDVDWVVDVEVVEVVDVDWVVDVEVVEVVDVDWVVDVEVVD